MLINKILDKKEKKVYLINDKYIIKKDTKYRLMAENIFLSLNSNELTERVIFYIKGCNFAIYEYQKGNKVRSNNVTEYVTQIKDYVHTYKKYEFQGYGDILNKVNSWENFLLNEINQNYNWMRDEEDKYEIAKIAIKVVSKYEFEKKIIHGDLGVYNIIFENNLVKKVIDPRTIIGDSTYDILFFIFSKPSFMNGLKIEDVMDCINEPKEKILNLMIVILYVRIAIHKKNNARTIEYEKMWNKLLNCR